MIEFIQKYFLLIVFGFIFAFVFISLIVRYCRDNFGTPKTLNVCIIDKHHNSYETSTGLFRSSKTKTNFVVVFGYDTEGKIPTNISFDVSPEFYKEAEIGEKGILKYRYTKIVSFDMEK